MILSVLVALSPLPPRAPSRRRAGGAKNLPIISSGGHPRRLSALEYVTTIAVEPDESE